MLLTRTCLISLTYSDKFARDSNMFASASVWLTAGNIWDAYQPYFSSQCLSHLSIGAVPVCCLWLCRSKLPCPRARHMFPAVDLVHIRLSSRGACCHHTPAPLPLSSFSPAPWLPSWHSLSLAWLQEQRTQLQKNIYFLRSFLLVLFFNSLVSVSSRLLFHWVKFFLVEIQCFSHNTFFQILVSFISFLLSPPYPYLNPHHRFIVLQLCKFSLSWVFFGGSYLTLLNIRLAKS